FLRIAPPPVHPPSQASVDLFLLRSEQAPRGEHGAELLEREYVLRHAASPSRARSAGALAVEPAFVDIAVISDPAAAAEPGSDLESIAAISVSQPRRWLEPWIETVGRATRVAPMLVVARDRRGVPVALLPFGARRSGMLRIAGFLGGKDSN